MASVEDCEDDLPATQPVGSLVLEGVVAYVEVRSGHDNRSRGVKAQLRTLGAAVVDHLTEEVTHVIFNEGLPSTHKKAKQLKCHLVSVLWIEACKNALGIVSEAGYPPIGQKMYEDPNALKKFKKLKSMQPDFDEDRDNEKIETILKRIKRRTRMADNNDNQVDTTAVESDKHVLPSLPKKAHNNRISKTARNKPSSNPHAKKSSHLKLQTEYHDVDKPMPMINYCNILKENRKAKIIDSATSNESLSSYKVEKCLRTPVSKKPIKFKASSPMSRNDFVDCLNGIVHNLRAENSLKPQEKSQLRAEVPPRTKSMSDSPDISPRRSDRRIAKQPDLGNARKGNISNNAPTRHEPISASAALVKRFTRLAPSSPGEDFMLLSQEPTDVSPSVVKCGFGRGGKEFLAVGGDKVRYTEVVDSYDRYARKMQHLQQSQRTSSTSKKSSSESAHELHVSRNLLSKGNIGNQWDPPVEESSDQESSNCLSELFPRETVQYQISEEPKEENSTPCKNGSSNCQTTNLSDRENIDCKSMSSHCASVVIRSGSELSFEQSSTNSVSCQRESDLACDLPSDEPSGSPNRPFVSSDINVALQKSSVNPSNLSSACGSSCYPIVDSSQSKERSSSPVFIINKSRVKRAFKANLTRPKLERSKDSSTGNQELRKMEQDSSDCLEYLNRTLSLLIKSPVEGSVKSGPTNVSSDLLPKTLLSPNSHLHRRVNHCPGSEKMPCAQDTAKQKWNGSSVEGSPTKAPRVISSTSASEVNISTGSVSSGEIEQQSKPTLSLKRICRQEHLLNLGPKEPNLKSIGCERAQENRILRNSPRLNTKTVCNEKSNEAEDILSKERPRASRKSVRSLVFLMPPKISSSSSDEKSAEGKQVTESSGYETCDSSQVAFSKNCASGQTPENSPLEPSRKRRRSDKVQNTPRAKVLDHNNLKEENAVFQGPGSTVKQFTVGTNCTGRKVTCPMNSRKSLRNLETHEKAKFDSNGTTRRGGAEDFPVHTKKKKGRSYRPLKQKEMEQSFPRKSARRNESCPELRLSASDESVQNLSMRSLRSSRRPNADKKNPVAVSRSSSRTPTPMVVCTFMSASELQEVEDAVKALGHMRMQNKVTSRTTHVVNTGPKRTINMLKGMVRGCWLLHLDWVLESRRRGSWLDEEPFELKQFSPAVQLYRKKRQNQGTTFHHTLFSKVGPIFISPEAKGPPVSDLRELVELCGGKLTSTWLSATLVIGADLSKKKEVTCVSSVWILDCITQNRILSPEDKTYSLT